MVTLTIEISESEMEALRRRARKRGGAVAPEEIVSEIVGRLVRKEVIRQDAAVLSNGSQARTALLDAVKRTPERISERRARSLERFGTSATLADGTHWSKVEFGAWPDSETEEALLITEKQIDDEDAGRW